MFRDINPKQIDAIAKRNRKFATDIKRKRANIYVSNDQ